jgi:hypothetical protein
MIRNRLLPSLALLLCCFGSAAHAADPEFKSTIVTASYTYDRQAATFSVAGVAAAGKTVTMSRVTVALDGELVTGEWESKTVASASAKDFRRGTDVLAAVNRKRLLLKLPKGEGEMVTAKIIKREKQKPPALRR